MPCRVHTKGKPARLVVFLRKLIVETAPTLWPCHRNVSSNRRENVKSDGVCTVDIRRPGNESSTQNIVLKGITEAEDISGPLFIKRSLLLTTHSK
jgi:hypothetical protein